ncbi:MAG: hypothetical protein KDD60_12145, partial [Bdellovibrionales bacterium]|nr:hypothetical protein [Bdellovibrionales bacterium]
ENLGVAPPETFDELNRSLDEWFRRKGLTFLRYSLRHGKLTLYTSASDAKFLTYQVDDLLDHLFIRNTGTVEEVCVRTDTAPSQPAGGV